MKLRWEITLWLPAPYRVPRQESPKDPLNQAHLWISSPDSSISHDQNPKKLYFIPTSSSTNLFRVSRLLFRKRAVHLISASETVLIVSFDPLGAVLDWCNEYCEAWCKIKKTSLSLYWHRYLFILDSFEICIWFIKQIFWSKRSCLVIARCATDRS